MVNIDEMTPELISELAFNENEMLEIQTARNKSIVFDEDCPEVTPERAKKFRRVNPARGYDTKGA